MSEETSSFGLTDRDVQTIMAILSKHPAVREVQVFGSRAKGNYQPGSDIDLAIMNEGVDARELSKLKATFEDSLLPYFIDVINFPELKYIGLREHIQRVGKIIYMQDECRR